MRKPGTDPANVQMSDVICDLCHREWDEAIPMLEGHQGSCVCGNCLTVAYTDLVLGGQSTAPDEFTCPMCLESGADRQALDRTVEGGWQSPAGDNATICRRCVELGAKALHRDKSTDWRKPD